MWSKIKILVLFSGKGETENRQYVALIRPQRSCFGRSKYHRDSASTVSRFDANTFKQVDNQHCQITKTADVAWKYPAEHQHYQGALMKAVLPIGITLSVYRSANGYLNTLQSYRNSSVLNKEAKRKMSTHITPPMPISYTDWQFAQIPSQNQRHVWSSRVQSQKIPKRINKHMNTFPIRQGSHSDQHPMKFKHSLARQVISLLNSRRM